MFMGNRKCTVVLMGLIGGAMVLGAAASQGTVIYQDTFPGSSANPLSGTSPSIDTGGATWTAGLPASGGWAANGSTPGGGGFQYASLPFATPAVSGGTYSVSGTLDPTGTTDSWLAIGFSNGSGFFSGVGPWMLLQDNGPIQLFAGPGTGGGPGNPAGTFSLGQTAEVVLNTTVADWTAEYYYNGISLGTYTYTGVGGSNPNPTGITTVGIGTNSEPGIVGDFMFQNSVVPEPATLGLMAAMGAGLLLLGRKRPQA